MVCVDPAASSRSQLAELHNTADTAREFTNTVFINAEHHTCELHNAAHTARVFTNVEHHTCEFHLRFTHDTKRSLARGRDHGRDSVYDTRDLTHASYAAVELEEKTHNLSEFKHAEYDAARSRSPPRRPKTRQPKTLAGIRVAKAAVNRLFKGREHALVLSALEILEAYSADPADLNRLGLVMCAEVDGLGGLVRKSAQQLSQLPDIVTAEALRQGLQGPQGKNWPRDPCKIKQQLMHAFPDAEIEVGDVLGTGCVGEVTAVVAGGVDGFRCAAKTVNPEQQQLFEEDFELFARLTEVLAIPLSYLDQINHQTAVEMKALVSKITDMASNRDLVDSVRNGFNMNVEMENSCRAAEVLHKIGCDAFLVPKMFAVSEDNRALLMELVEGESLEQHCITAVVPQEFIRDFIGLYVRMLFLEGYLHQDPRPANVIVLARSGAKGKFALIDWGEVVKVPSEHQKDVQVLFTTVVNGCWMGEEHDTLGGLFRRLGVEEKSDRNADGEAYQALANMLNVVQALRGDPQENNNTLVGVTAFRVPGWLEAWQKATNAFAISLQAAGASPETVRDELLRALIFH